MKFNILERGAEIGGILGIKGLLGLAGLCVGITGLTYGVKTAGKVHTLTQQLKDFEKSEKVDLTPLEKVDDLYEAVKHISSSSVTGDQFKALTSEIGEIKGKINDFNIAYDEGKSTGGEIEELIKGLNSLKDELTGSNMDLSQSVNNLSGNLVRRFDQFSNDYEQTLKNLETSLNELKSETSEIKEEVKNNQSDIVDINNNLYTLTEKIECLTKRAKREDLREEKKPETSPQIIVESSTPVEVEAFDQSNLIEFSQVNTHKDVIKGQIGEINSEFTEEKPIQLENIEGKTIEHNIGLIEIVEDSGTEILTGYHEIEVHLEDENSILVVNSTEENAEIGITQDTVPFIAIDTSDVPTFNDINIDISSNYIDLNSRPAADVVSGSLLVVEQEEEKE